MPKHLVLILMALSLLCLLGAAVTQADVDEVASQIAAVVDITEPIFLELTTGEWTPMLDPSLRKALLAKGADIREIMQDAQSPEALDDSLQAFPELSTYDLKTYALTRARLVQITNEVSWDIVERKSFLSYKQEQRQINRFTIKQIGLPDYKLKAVDEYSLIRNNPDSVGKSNPRLHWFEPLFASLAVASLVFLLWTTQ